MSQLDMPEIGTGCHYQSIYHHEGDVAGPRRQRNQYLKTNTPEVIAQGRPRWTPTTENSTLQTQPHKIAAGLRQ